MSKLGNQPVGKNDIDSLFAVSSPTAPSKSKKKSGGDEKNKNSNSQREAMSTRQLRDESSSSSSGSDSDDDELKKKKENNKKDDVMDELFDAKSQQGEKKKNNKHQDPNNNDNETSATVSVFPQQGKVPPASASQMFGTTSASSSSLRQQQQQQELEPHSYLTSMRRFKATRRDTFSMSNVNNTNNSNNSAPETPQTEKIVSSPGVLTGGLSGRRSSSSSLSESSGRESPSIPAATSPSSSSSAANSPSPQQNNSNNSNNNSASAFSKASLDSLSSQPQSPSKSGASGKLPQQQQQQQAAAQVLTAPIIQIPVPGLQDIFGGVDSSVKPEDDNSHLPLQPGVRIQADPRWKLPSAFDMPPKLRCDFCLKFDSMCFNCHKKWREIDQPHRRAAVSARFMEVPEAARVAVFFVSCARGHIDFVKLVLKLFPAAHRWISELSATRYDLQLSEEKQELANDSWDEMFLKQPGIDMEVQPPPKCLRPALLKYIGRHTALHVAVAYDQLEIARLLLDHSQQMLRSEKRLLPFQLLPDEVNKKKNPEDTSSDDEDAIEKKKKKEKEEEEEEEQKKEKEKQEQKEKEAEAKKKEGEGEEQNKKETTTEEGEEKEVVAVVVEDRHKDDYIPASLRGDEYEEKPPTHEERIAQWHQLFNSKPALTELIMANRARQLRVMKKWTEAEKVYAKLLKKNPRHEHALCGRAKMLFDREMFDECIRQCRDILQLDMFGGVQWLDFDNSTVNYLMESALKVIHDRAHAVRGETLKSCGCVYTDKVRLPVLTRVQQKFFVKFVCPFIDVQSSFQVARAFSGAWRFGSCMMRGFSNSSSSSLDASTTSTATTASSGEGNSNQQQQQQQTSSSSSSLPSAHNEASRLGRGVIRTLQANVSSLPSQVLTPLLYSNAEIAVVLNQLRTEVPKENADKWLPPFVTRGFSVVAFCDFDKILLKAVVEARNPAFKKSMFAKFKKNCPELIALTKEFEIRQIQNVSSYPSRSSSTTNLNVASLNASAGSTTGFDASNSSVFSPTGQQQEVKWVLVESSGWEISTEITISNQVK